MESLESCVGAVEAMAADAVDPAHHLELLAELERAHGSIDMHLGGAGDGPLELRGRAALVLLLARAAPSTAARRLRGADVVDLLGPRHAIDALVGAVVDGRRGDRAELRNLAAALGDCMLPTAYFRDDALDGPNEEAMAQLAKRFSGHVNHAARAILAQRALPLLLASGDDDVLAEALRIFADMMAFATEYTAKVRQHVAADCPFLVPDVLSILSRCLARLRAGADDGDDAAWDRAVLAARVLTVVTFKIKAARRSVCDANPTCAFLDAIEADQRREAPRLCGAGGAVALLVKLNVNIDGGFGPDWRAEAFSNAAAVGALVANLPRAARAQVSRHTALYDGTPVNRGSRAWPIFLSHVPLQNPTVQKSARAPVRAQRQTTLDGAPVRRRAEGKGDDDAPPAPSEAKHPTGAVEERGVSDSKAESKADSDADSKGEPSVDDAPTSPAAGDHSPPPSPPRGDGTSPRGDDASLRGDGDCKAEAYGASWVPHHLPPLRDSAAAAHGDGFTFGRLRSAAAPPPPAFLCALTGAVMDEPVAVAGGGGAVRGPRRAARFLQRSVRGRRPAMARLRPANRRRRRPHRRRRSRAADPAVPLRPGLPALARPRSSDAPRRGTRSQSSPFVETKNNRESNFCHSRGRMRHRPSSDHVHQINKGQNCRFLCAPRGGFSVCGWRFTSDRSTLR